MIQFIVKIIAFMQRMREDNVGVYAAQSSFFLILSMFPIIMLILTIIANTSLTMDSVLGLQEYLPTDIAPLYKSVVTELYASANGAIISITAVTAVWSASKGVLSVIRGLNSVYHIEESRNYFVLRFIAMFYTVIIVVSIIFSLIVLVFGNSILVLLSQYVPIIYNVISHIFRSRTLISFIILTLLFVFAYQMVRVKDMKFLSYLPGAIFSSLGWILFSYFFSLYIKYSSSFSYMYGSLTAVVVMMLWFYINMYIVFIGAEINVYFHDTFTNIEYRIRKH
ncbi:MAG: YihY/virulence factor BrkB family protein [Lachnospiraceae bacterium]|nr:YihY/virulence factor BrkB family protein [Lachnospiraceae bacterium]